MASSLRPPINRAMKSLDRAFFSLTVPISAARVVQNQFLSKLRSQLLKTNDLIEFERLSPIARDPEPELAAAGRKCLLLRSDLKHNDSSTWGETISELVKSETIGIIPYTLHINYDFWTYNEIMNAILPEDSMDEIPSGFQLVGHVAHLNLRSQYLQFKNLIATVIIDKNPVVKSVINKIDTVGEESEYRTFSYEVLAGDGNMNVSLIEQNCVFDFNYAKVYWNSRLSTEHERLVQSFKPGEAVCDVMAGIGPFAIPAGKKKVFVWANDLNPESFKYLEAGVQKNKVSGFVRPFNEDGRAFIRTATKQLYEDNHSVTIRPKGSRSNTDATTKPPRPIEVIPQPKTFSHFVMNLPASAITFVPSFIGLYHQAGIPEGQPLPLIHVYCFGLKTDKNTAESERLRDEVSSLLDFKFTLGDESQEGQLSVYDVRDVAPTKRMFCISFRLPSEVAHRQFI